MYFRSLFLTIFAAIGFFANCTANAQSLAAVLSSVQERKLLLEQAQGFIRTDPDYYPGMNFPGGASGSFELITWTGCPAFPVDNDLSVLSIEGRVNLLNQARRQFQIIRAGFVNTTPQALDPTTGVRPPAVIRRFDELSLPTPPVANHLNYIQVIRELSCKVDVLRVTPWPVACTVTTGTTSNDIINRPRSSGSDKIQWSEIAGSQSTPRRFWAPERPVFASFGVAGRNYETNTGTTQNPHWEPREYRYAERIWPSAFQLSYLPTDLSLPSGVTPVQGKCVVLAEQQNSPYLAAAGIGADATPIPLRGGYQIIKSASTAGAQSIPAPEWVVSGSWVGSGNPDSSTTRSELVFKPTLGSSSVYDPYFSNGYLYQYKCIDQNIVFLMVPAFTKGLDVIGSGGHSTDFQWDRPRSPGNPGDLAVSGGAAKLSIDAGVGDAMYVGGTVQIQHGWTAFPGITGGTIQAPAAYPDVLWGHPKGSFEYLDYFTDEANHRRFPLSFGTQLRFAGPERDYEVIYETRFGDGRANLEKTPVPTLGSPLDGWKNTMAYYREWQKPRLRQVLGREALIDVAVGANDCTHTISIYRIPVGHTVTRNANGFVSTTGLLLLKTVEIANPTAGPSGFPTDDMSMTVKSEGGTWSVNGSPAYGEPFDWDVTLKKTDTQTVLSEETWRSEIDYTILDPLTLNPTAYEAPVVASVEVVRKLDGEDATETTSTLSMDASRSLLADPLPRVTHISRESAAGTENTGLTYEAGDQAPEFPTTIISDSPQEPQIRTKLYSSGIPDFVEQGAGTSLWKSHWALETDGRLIEEKSLGGAIYGRNWTKWENDGWTITHFSAADGTATAAVDWSTLEIGKIGGVGFTGLSHKLTNKDGSGATWGWTMNPDFSGKVDFREGLLASGSVSRGTSIQTSINTRGYSSGTQTFVIQPGIDLFQVSGSSVAANKVTGWGAPTESQDYTTGLKESWAFDGNRERLSSASDALGVTTAFTAYDSLERLTGYTWDGKTGSLTHNDNGFNISGTLAIPGRTTGFSQSWDGVGRPLGASVTAGSTRSVNVARTADTETLTTSDTATTASGTVVIHTPDNSIASVSGNTRPFGGTSNTGGLSVDEDGLLKSKTQLAGQTASFQTTWTDAWGRIRKTETPSTAPGGTDQTLCQYDNPAAVKRVVVREPSGRKLITESDPNNAAGNIRRSGIDVNEDGELTANSTDRYVESTTTIFGGKVRTTLKCTDNTGLREILLTDWSPTTDVTVTTLKGNEETITRTPDYTAKTVTTHSTKGWDKNEAFNNLGLATLSGLSGTGIPVATLDPTWRADGSLSEVSLNIGGETHSASFNNDGTLASLIVPDNTSIYPNGRNILGEHSFANGVEKLTIDGVTTTSKLDGTEKTISGTDVIGKTEELATSGTGFKLTTTPAGEAATNFTHVTLNAAGAFTAKTYAAGNGEGREYFPGGLLKEVTLARSSVSGITYGYSGDGAKDLTSATWPTVPSGVLGDIPGLANGFTYTRGGQVETVTDASGARSLGYQNGRLSSTVYTAGPLRGYEIIRNHDTIGRETGIVLKRDGATLHSTEKAPNGASDQITALASGPVKIVPQRGLGGSITGYQWGNPDGTFVPTVTQTWQRGAGGRILSASSNVTGAPSFDYKGTANNEATAFDSKGRRHKVKTAGADWTYGYTNGRLTSASHPTLGTFNYQFDSIGRRTDQGSDTSDSLLNQTLGWTNTQIKNLKVAAHADARVWVGIGTAAPTEIPSFTGSYQATIGAPDVTGRWVPWHTLAILEGQGDAGANPDAKAQQSGAVWVPPTHETFTYDPAGNRESSALWDFGWDAKNQLVRSRTKDYNTAPQGYDITNAYDAEGRRFGKRVNRYQNGGIVEQKVITFLHDGDDIIYERHQLPSGLTTLERKYLWGPDIAGGSAGGAGGLLLIRETKGNVTIDLYPLYDGTGHVVALTDSTGALQAEYAYGPFGEPIYARGPHAQSCPFRYATKYYDQETGFYDFGRRFLDPITGQWLSREPLGESESINLYAYCGNDPVNHVDVLGLQGVEVTSKWQADRLRLLWFIEGLKDDGVAPAAPSNRYKGNHVESGSFGLFSPYTASDVAEVLRVLDNPGLLLAPPPAPVGPVMRSISPEESAASQQPRYVEPEWIPSMTAPLTLGAANTPFNANINSGFLFPSGVGAWTFGMARSFQMFRVLSAGAATERYAALTAQRMEALTASTAKTTWLDFRAQAQMIQDAVKAEYGGVQAFNMAVKAPIGFADDAVESAFVGLRGGGGHAIRHLEGNLISGTGSLASRVSAFHDIAVPILKTPTYTAPWRIGATQAQAFIGQVNGQYVAIIVAKEGPQAGKIISSFVPDINQLVLMMSR